MDGVNSSTKAGIGTSRTTLGAGAEEQGEEGGGLKGQLRTETQGNRSHLTFYTRTCVPFSLRLAY